MLLTTEPFLLSSIFHLTVSYPLCYFPSYCFIFSELSSRPSDVNLQPASGGLLLSFEFFLLLILPHSYLRSIHAVYLTSLSTWIPVRTSEMMCQAKHDSYCASSVVPLNSGARFLRSHCRCCYTSPLPSWYDCTDWVLISKGCKALVFS